MPCAIPNSLPSIVQSRERLLRQAGIMATGLNINRERLLSYVYVHACLSACWSLEDGQDPSLGLAMAKIAESCISESSVQPATTARNASGVSPQS